MSQFPLGTETKGPVHLFRDMVSLGSSSVFAPQEPSPIVAVKMGLLALLGPEPPLALTRGGSPGWGTGSVFGSILVSWVGEARGEDARLRGLSWDLWGRAPRHSGGLFPVGSAAAPRCPCLAALCRGPAWSLGSHSPPFLAEGTTRGEGGSVCCLSRRADSRHPQMNGVNAPVYYSLKRFRRLGSSEAVRPGRQQGWGNQRTADLLIECKVAGQPVHQRAESSAHPPAHCLPALFLWPLAALTWAGSTPCAGLLTSTSLAIPSGASGRKEGNPGPQRRHVPSCPR